MHRDRWPPVVLSQGRPAGGSGPAGDHPPDRRGPARHLSARCSSDRLPGLLPRVWGSGVAFALLNLCADASAAPEPGAFAVRAGQTRAEVHAWGEDCGPRPADRAEATGATYQLDAEGRLRPEGRATALFAPGVCRQATGLAALTEQLQGSQGRCTSVDPARKVEGHLTLTSADRNGLEVGHRFHYDWIFRGQRCLVDLSSTWQLARVQPLPPAERCTQPGVATTLEPVGASRRRIRTGGTVRLEVRARDAAGCAATASVRWTASHGVVDEDGRWRGLEVAPATRVSVEARAGEAAHTFTLEVGGAVAAAPSVATVDTDELLPDEPGAPTAPAPSLPEQTAVGFETHADPPPTPRRWGTLLVGLFVAFGLLATLLALWIAMSAWRLRRRTLAEAGEGSGAMLGPAPPLPGARGAPAAQGAGAPRASRGAAARPETVPGAARRPGPSPAGGARAAGATPSVPRRPLAADQTPAAGAPPVSVPPTPARAAPGAASNRPADEDETTRTQAPAVPPEDVIGRPASAPAASTPMAASGPVTGEHARPVRGARACPTCHRCFDDTSRFCPYDGAGLEPLDGPSLDAETARICPRCASVFPASATHCGHDGAPLLTAGANTQPVPALRARICPHCATHYPLDATFCGLDGAALVLLN